jgi:drug/metabolite transporter (DMT)-like permease
MVFVVGILAAVSFGLGWVLQQRVAAHAALSELLSYKLMLHLMRNREWWFGIGAMICGQALGGFALQLGAVALVEPLLSTNLLFAFLIAGGLGRRRAQWREIAGALLLSAALGVFIEVGDPHAPSHPTPSWHSGLIAVIVVGGLAAALVSVAKSRGMKHLATEAVLLATAAGILYGLQDVSTQAALLSFDDHGLRFLINSPWAYIVIGAAATGILMSQSAFRAARLDYSLPPTAVAEPIVGILIGLFVLGDRLSVSTGALAVEAVCLVAMVAGTFIIGRSDMLGSFHHRHLEKLTMRATDTDE